MALRVKALATQADRNLSLRIYTEEEGKEPTPCPLTSTHVAWHLRAHTGIHTFTHTMGRQMIDR